MEGLGDQSVKIRYVPNSPWSAGWYGGTDRDSAQSVRLSNGKTTKITIVMPDPA
ncbi:hypothetical protein [Micromonospora sp. NPDC047740]|uniref:hypothetical protein n=1 Tax=Micromonospora sp. NPDC047740 TaxID=3364254 RepID=UPI00371C9DBA